jgi:hypothetical protein
MFSTLAAGTPAYRRLSSPGQCKPTTWRLLVLLMEATVLTGSLRGVAIAQPAPTGLVTVRSVSGQFVAYAARSATLPAALLPLATNRTFVQLEPTLATVSCERIKQLVVRELGLTTPWRGTIYLMLYSARSEGDTIAITSERFKDGWQYRVELPDVVERSRYVRAIVEVLLIEMGNRRAQNRAVEVPPWLIEGLTQMLLASNQFEIILPPPRSSANGLTFNAGLFNGRKETPFQQAQRTLRGRPPLSFEELSWPSAQALDGEAGEVYRGSALLFVGELLRLPDGRDSLRRMLELLPQYLNWQFAFLGAFPSRFQRPLDVEKWWSLSVTDANGRDPAQAWTPEESWQRLGQALRPTMQVRSRTNEPPLQVNVTLQKAIREWDPMRQALALDNTLRELGLLRPRIAQEYLGLVQDYCQAIQTYYQQLDHSSSALTYSKRAARRRLVEAAVQQLDTLDSQRELTRPAPKPAAASTSPAPPASGP